MCFPLKSSQLAGRMLGLDHRVIAVLSD